MGFSRSRKKEECARFVHRKENALGLLGFRDWPLMLVGIPFLGFILPVLFFQMSISEAAYCFSHSWIWSILFTSVFWLGNRAIIIFFRKVFPNHADLHKRLVKQLLMMIIFTAAASVLLSGLEKNAEIDFGFIDKNSFGVVRTFIASFTSTILVASIYESAYFFFRWKESIAETEKLKRERASSELQALRNQVNPHFLFNSLNTLASIIPEDPKKSVEFVQKMSAVYRKILDLNEKEAVTLAEELLTLDEYLFLVQTRFPENLHVVKNIQPDDMKRFVVPMSLQNLVENAIKHNVVSKKKPLVITIDSIGDFVEVRNELQPKLTDETSTGTGLLNIENRYRLTFGRSIEIDKTEHSFGVKLPLVKIEER